MDISINTCDMNKLINSLYQTNIYLDYHIHTRKKITTPRFGEHAVVSCQMIVCVCFSFYFKGSCHDLGLKLQYQNFGLLLPDSYSGDDISVDIEEFFARYSQC